MSPQLPPSSSAEPGSPERSPSSPAPAATRAPFFRGWRVAAAAAAVVPVLLLTAVLAIGLIDWNWARPWVNERVTEASGRHFEIQGRLHARWVWPQPLDQGWRHWIPGVVVEADQLVLGNRPGFGEFGALDAAQARSQPPPLPPPLPPQARAPANAGKPAATAQEGLAVPAKPLLPHPPGASDSDPTPPMARIEHATASLRLLPLLRRVVLVDRLDLTGPDVALARTREGDNNWTFPRNDEEARKRKPNPWAFEVGDLALSQGRLAYADAIQRLALRAALDTETNAPAPKADADTTYGLRFTVQGKYRDAEVAGSGRLGQLLSLRNVQLDYPIAFDLRAGATRAQGEGTLANPRKFSGVDLRVALQGQSMADLYELTGLVLPNTPPYQTSGRLVGSLEPERATWDYEGFTGVVGQSDLQGHVTYISGQPRPRLTGQMKSRKLQLADLGPVVGTDTQERKKKKDAKDKVLPTAAFATKRWDAMDVDIAFLGQELKGPAALPLDDLSVRAVLKDGVLKLNPLRFGVAKGRIDAQVSLDSHSDPLKAQVLATVDALQLSALFPKIELMHKSLGRLDGAFALRGQGASVANMLATSDGEARLYVRDGVLSKQLLDLAALNLGSVVVAKLFGADKEVRVRCAVADLAVKKGMAQTRSVKLSTNEAIVEAVGTIDFNNEHVDLRIKPESLDWKFFSLRTPLTVKGPFAKPDVGVEVGPLLARAGAAVVAAVAAPAALALVPITVPAAEDDANCAKLMARADKAVKAGPAGAAPRPEAHTSGVRAAPAATPKAAPAAPIAAPAPVAPTAPAAGERAAQAADGNLPR